MIAIKKYNMEASSPKQRGKELEGVYQENFRGIVYFGERISIRKGKGQMCHFIKNRNVELEIMKSRWRVFQLSTILGN